MATAAKITGAITRWWWVRHAPVPNPEGRCYGQSDKDCDVSNEALFKHQAKLLPKGAVWYSSNLLRARKTAEHLGRAGAEFGEVLIDPDLAEQHFGYWQGLTYTEIAEKPRRQSSVLAGTAGEAAAGRRELQRPARPHGALDRAADRQVSRPRHRGDGAWRHHPRRAGTRLQHASRGGGALRDRQCLDHPDRAFRAGRSRRMPGASPSPTTCRATWCWRTPGARHEEPSRTRRRAGGLLERAGRQDVAGRLRAHPARHRRFRRRRPRRRGSQAGREGARCRLRHRRSRPRSSPARSAPMVVCWASTSPSR